MIPGLEPAASLPDDAVEVARVQGAWGIKGWIRIRPHSASPEALFSARCWYFATPERGRKPDWGSSFLRAEVRQVRWHGESVVAWLQGLDDRTAAEQLKGARLLVERSLFPELEADEYYWVDLIGLRVVNREGLDLGEVVNLMSTGPQEVLVLQAESPEEGEPLERLIPFVNAYVDAVDLVGRRITVDWQPDY